MAFELIRDPLAPRATQVRRAAASGPVLRAEELLALQDAEALLAAARAEADAIVAGAQAAFEAERQRGYAEGRQEALMQQAEKTIEIVSRTVDYFASVEQEVIELVMTAVRKVVDGFDDHARVVAVVRNALAVVRNQKQMVLRLHPDEVETVRQTMPDLLADYPGVGYLDLVADARLARGACILESEIGMVEASLEAQMAVLRQAFERVLGGRDAA